MTTTTATLPKILFSEWEKLEVVAGDLIEQLDGDNLSHKTAEEYRQLVLTHGLQHHGLPEWVDDIGETEDQEDWYQKIADWPCAYVEGEEEA